MKKEERKGTSCMWIALRVFSVFLSLMLMATSGVFAVDYPYKKVADFKTLESYKSIDEFESRYEKYAQHCLDNTGGGSGGVPCFIGYEIWNRELNIY